MVRKLRKRCALAHNRETCAAIRAMFEAGNPRAAYWLECWVNLAL